MSPNLRGAALMAASMAAFTLNDTLMKSISGEMSMFQAVLLRGIASTGLMIALAARFGMLQFRMPRRDRAMILLRALSEVAATYFFITALFNMPIANTSAIMQALPLTVTLAGALFLREPVGWPRLIAILVGFVGVMLIVRPGAAGFTIYSVYVFISVLAVTARDLVTRGISAGTPSMMPAIAASVAVMLFGAAGVAGEEWRPVSGFAALSLVGASVMIMGGYVFATATMRVGDIGFVAPFRYTSLLWALFLGLVVFGEWPDALTLTGAAIVVATGIYTLHRERRSARRARPAASPAPVRQASVDNPGDSL